MTTLQIGGKQCYLFRHGGERTLLWGVARGSSTTVQQMDRLLHAQTRTSYQMLAFEVDSWADDFSPWAADAVRGMAFGGRATDTLGWIRTTAIPSLAAHRPWIGGYSLAGLFALWALGSGVFGGAVACSPSLWFPGWAEYADFPLPDGCDVYLSIGTRETHPRHPAMASVGARVQSFAERLRQDPACRWCRTEYVPGGHFTDPVGRMARGFAALLNAAAEGEP